MCCGCPCVKQHNERPKPAVLLGVSVVVSAIWNPDQALEICKENLKLPWLEMSGCESSRRNSERGRVKGMACADLPDQQVGGAEHWPELLRTTGALKQRAA